VTRSRHATSRRTEAGFGSLPAMRLSFDVRYCQSVLLFQDRRAGESGGNRS